MLSSRPKSGRFFAVISSHSTDPQHWRWKYSNGSSLISGCSAIPVSSAYSPMRQINSTRFVEADGDTQLLALFPERIVVRIAPFAAVHVVRAHQNTSES